MTEPEAASRRRRRRRSQPIANTPYAFDTDSIERAARWGFCLLMVVFPLFYGGNRDWVWGVALSFCSLLSLMTLWSVNVVDRLAKVGVHARRPWLLIAILAWMALGAFYVLPGASSDTAASVRAVLKSALYVQIFLLSLVLLNTHTRVKLTLRLLFFAAVLHAALASVYKLWGKSLITRYFIFGPPSGLGSFVNENHFAGYLELHLAVGAGLLIMGLKFHSQDAQGWRRLLRDWVALLLDNKTQVRLAMVLLVIALVLTGSRMGNVAFFVALLLTGGLAYFIMAYRPPALRPLIISLVVIDLLVVGSWFGADQIAARLSVTRLELSASANVTESTVRAAGVEQKSVELDAERPGLVRVSWSLYQQAPWFGHGAGSFRSVFPSARTTDLSHKFYDHAHNDFVQLLVEYGLVGGMIAALIVLMCLRAAYRALRSRSDKTALGCAFCAIFGITSLLIHGVADFNFQIPANAALFSFLLGLAWVSYYGFRLPPSEAKTAEPLR